jgi:hypothetical protein
MRVLAEAYCCAILTWTCILFAQPSYADDFGQNVADLAQDISGQVKQLLFSITGLRCKSDVELDGLTGQFSISFFSRRKNNTKQLRLNLPSG